MTQLMDFYFDGTQVFVGEKVLPISGRVNLGLGRVQLAKGRSGLYLNRFSGHENFIYGVKLNKIGQYRLGPNYGHRVVSPSEESDPLRRTLRALKIPMRFLQQDLSSSNITVERNQCWRTDGERMALSEKEVDCISGASYAIRYVFGEYQNGVEWLRVNKVLVCPDCDHEKFVKALGSLLGLHDIDLEYINCLSVDNALKARAREWVNGRAFEISVRENEIWLSKGRGYPEIITFSQFDSSPVWGNGAVGRLLEKFGVDVIKDIIPESIDSFLTACKDPEKAIKWLQAKNIVISRVTYAGEEAVSYKCQETFRDIDVVFKRKGADGYICSNDVREVIDSHGGYELGMTYSLS